MNRTPRRVVVISDLHLGGRAPTMMTSGARLARFITGLPARRRDGEALELVIAGDFIDILAEPPFASWTADWRAARAKLRATLGSAEFGPVFDALGAIVAAGHALTVLIGNHDLELALPALRQALLDRLGTDAHGVHFVDDGRAYRVGRLLVEHGNRYDPANENDWTNLRTIASAQSRGEETPVALRPSAGSWVVEKVVSPLKARYPFIDLLQPQGELLALLLAAFEPGLILDLPKLARVLRARKLEAKKEFGQPGRVQAVAAPDLDTSIDPLLKQTFGEAYDALRSQRQDVSITDVLAAAWNARRDGLSELFDRGEPIPPKRLEQIRVAMRAMLLDAAEDRPDGPTERYGAEAARLIADSDGEVETVVMGHTHLPRHAGPPARAHYINSGTWADVIRVPAAVLKPGAGAALTDFLRGLRDGQGRQTPATYADVRVEADGRVSEARLRADDGAP